MSNENRTMTAAERAALANAREAEAQRKKYASQAQSKPTVTRSAAPKSATNTKEYAKPQNIKPNATVKPATQPKKAPEKEDTGEFPSYVRMGKGGYRPPRSQKRSVARQHRRKLDPRFKAALLAACSIVLIITVLLICGVRYTTTKLSDGSEIRFFGVVKDGQPTSGWIKSSTGEGGKLKNSTIKYSDGSIYEGGMVGTLRSGIGKMTYKNGDVYEGTFLENKMNGQFTVTFANGNSYVGGMVNDEYSGHGVLTFANKSVSYVYEGDFANGMKNGKGKMTYSDGKVYEGYFENDKKNGQGRMDYNEESFFEGTFKNDLREKGLYRFENGAEFNGTFEQNDENIMFEGTYKYRNGGTIVGKYDKVTGTFIPNE